MSDFPLDDATLIMLSAACDINPETEQTHLQDFLRMGERIKGYKDMDGDPIKEEEMEDGVVYEVEHERGYAPFSEHQVIRALVAEVLRLRSAQ